MLGWMGSLVNKSWLDQDHHRDSRKAGPMVLCVRACVCVCVCVCACLLVVLEGFLCSRRIRYAA